MEITNIFGDAYNRIKSFAPGIDFEDLAESMMSSRTNRLLLGGRVFICLRFAVLRSVLSPSLTAPTHFLLSGGSSTEHFIRGVLQQRKNTTAQQITLDEVNGDGELATENLNYRCKTGNVWQRLHFSGSFPRLFEFLPVLLKWSGSGRLFYFWRFDIWYITHVCRFDTYLFSENRIWFNGFRFHENFFSRLVRSRFSWIRQKITMSCPGFELFLVKPVYKHLLHNFEAFMSQIKNSTMSKKKKLYILTNT